jgi:hypothetical protein
MKRSGGAGGRLQRPQGTGRSTHLDLWALERIGHLVMRPSRPGDEVSAPPQSTS